MATFNYVGDRDASATGPFLTNVRRLDLTKHFWTFKHFGNFVKREQHMPILFCIILLIECSAFSWKSTS